MNSHLETLSKEERLKIYKSIRQYLDKRGLDVDEIRKITGHDLNKHNEGKFLNLVIKPTK